MHSSMTMEVPLAYGTKGLLIELPSAITTVVEPTYTPPVEDPATTLQRALREPIGNTQPLREAVRSGDQLAISICDITRPQPRRAMVEAILDELDGVVDPEAVTLLIATGTHRPSKPHELTAMLGDDLIASCRIIDHDARDISALVNLGGVGQVESVLLNRAWMEADVRITTGFVEPHFFAGFSGGPKMVAPGLAGLATVLELHDARRIGDPRATCGYAKEIRSMTMCVPSPQAPASTMRWM